MKLKYEWVFLGTLQPFGHNLTQASILEQNTILHAKEVNFPAKPIVSQEAKVGLRQITSNSTSFILLCLVELYSPLSLLQQR